METCFFCERKAITYCNSCRKSICRVHAEEVGKVSIEHHALCSSCLHKRKLKRIRAVAISIIIIFALIVAMVLIINSLQSLT